MTGRIDLGFIGWLGRLPGHLGAPFRSLLSQEGRRAWALMLLAGGGVAMTIYAGFTLWFVRESPSRVFWLGVGALILIGIVLTGFAGLLIKRTIRVSRDGIEIEDAVVAAAAEAAARTISSRDEEA
ncbi:hypothetical protein [Sphingosinithalassobacter portus]|uniref:hypothetical protein n=1 Tax=Stakelama portus TaxID=2676234 RepID=UPI000D6E7EDA|nr:hypothetical protein [Sphingosinithalassobacter portus]